MKEIAAKIKLENLKVVGITNYFIVEEREIEELKSELNDEVLLIPNFEFRITEKNNDGEFVNVHVLFNPKIKINQIHDTLGRIQLANIAALTYCTLENIKRIGVESITVTLKDLIEQLNKDFTPIEDFFVVGVNRGYGGFFPSSKPRDIEFAIKMDTESHFIFSSKNDANFFLNRTGDERSKHNLFPKPVVECCDAHTIGDIGKKYTWIKAETTFEGLKQILFEPFHRLTISETVPREPVRKIESIKFNFPINTTYIKKIGSDAQQSLCITHLKNEIFFSPNFTCLIGGRGTGKSTIINILAERLGNETDFFNSSNNQIYIENKVANIRDTSNSIVEIKGTEEIEFVSQGRIEKLAEGEELTKLVFNERIREVESDFYNLENEFNLLIGYLDSNIKLHFQLQDQRILLVEREKERSISQKIVDSEKDPRYKEISDAIKEYNSELSTINNSKEQYTFFLSSLKDIINDVRQNNSTNEYELRLKEIIDSIISIDELKIIGDELHFTPNEFEKTEQSHKEFSEKLKVENEKLIAFLTEKGTSEESIKDSQNAAENIARLSQNIASISQQIEAIILKGKENSEKTTGIKDNYIKTEKLINEKILAINERLKPKNANENIREVKFTYEFNYDLYKSVLFSEFYETFKKFQLPNVQVDKVKEVLFLIAPNEELLEKNADDFAKLLEAEIVSNGYNMANLYVKIITNIFSVKTNFNIYKTLIQKHRYNLTKFIRIKGYYEGKELNSCSFGQRCTAVIVTLLMTGVKPLVIDEPEAHLDNRLIADYLVELIKTKKLDRQIIFATHNSNFVINGDAELIHILEIPEGNLFTNLISTTIEDIDNRPKLLKLEGGKDAFLSRENKYGLFRSMVAKVFE